MKRLKENVMVSSKINYKFFNAQFPDIDECETNTHGCHDNASCRNHAGNYSCICQQGFYGDGQVCDGKRQHSLWIIEEDVVC